MSTTRRFSRPALAAIDATKYLRVRAGADHRFIAVWVVVVDGRVFARSWNDKPGGWYRAFLEEPAGAIQVSSGAEIPVRAKRARGERLMDAIEQAYGEKYRTPASVRYVRGFKRPRRRATTMEFVPR